jgi:putative phosphoribosyl transferase
MFCDRSHAGFLLGQKLLFLKDNDPLVFAIPRGGVPVAFEVAKVLQSPLNVIVSRKLGVPRSPELAMGAISENGVVVLNKKIVTEWCVSSNDTLQTIERERVELTRRINLYRKGKKLPQLVGKTVIVVDDGLATGATAIAAIKAIKKSNPLKIYFASPVAATDSLVKVKRLTDGVVALVKTDQLRTVGEWYQDFRQVTDEEVISALSWQSEKS